MLSVVKAQVKTDGVDVADLQVKKNGNAVIVDWGDVTVTAYPIGGPAHAEVRYTGTLWVENKSSDSILVIPGELILEGKSPATGQFGAGAEARLLQWNATIYKMGEKGSADEGDAVSSRVEAKSINGADSFSILPGEEGHASVTYMGEYSNDAAWNVAILRSGIKSSVEFSFAEGK